MALAAAAQATAVSAAEEVGIVALGTEEPAAAGTVVPAALAAPAMAFAAWESVSVVLASALAVGAPASGASAASAVFVESDSALASGVFVESASVQEMVWDSVLAEVAEFPGQGLVSGWELVGSVGSAVPVPDHCRCLHQPQRRWLWYAAVVRRDSPPQRRCRSAAGKP